MRKIKHGKYGTRLFNIYNNIKYRCYNRNHHKYKIYGARGITMCDEWLHDFMTFYDWAVNNGYNESLTIDRIDVNGNYEPNNCRWVDMKTQQRNRRNNSLVTYRGETKTLSEWCELLGLNYKTVQSRLRYGWSIVRAFELEVT